MIWWLLAAAAAGVAVAPFLREALRPRMGATARARAPGAFATLSQGVTHYRWLGAAEGPVAVCVHGLTTPSFVWEGIARGLGRMGYRVLLYDLYGRGYSDRPRGAQDADFFVTQLEDLLDHQRVGDGVTLLGYSMGGAIATAFAARHAGRLQRLILLAPAGMKTDLGPVARLVVNHDWLGRWLMRAFYGRSFARAVEEERRLDSSVPDIVARQLAELHYRGFRRSVLASLRGILDADMEAAHRAVARTGLPVLAIWGREDAVIPISAMGRLAEWNRAARQEVIEDAGHAMAYTHTEEVLAIIGAEVADQPD
jgi:pimeloyl-ACP methyl ester carboxylesterase